jgi:hypothetical protein
MPNTVSPVGIMPDKLIEPDQRREALQWLLAQPFLAGYKVELWNGWHAWTGVEPDADELALVRSTGIDV